MRRRLLLAGSLGVLAAPAAAAEPDVAIVGAGVAGLAAARALMAAGKTVQVIEARERIGGRAFTDSGLGFPFDHGAQFLEAGALDKALGGKRMTQSRQALALGSKQLSPEDYARYEKVSLELQHKAEEVAKAIPGIDPWTVIRPKDKLEVLAIVGLTHRTIFDPGPFSAEGLGTLVARFGARVPVKLGTRVVRIDSTGKQVLLVTTAGELKARAAIVTVPVGVLAAGFGFAPPLAAPRREAIAAARTAPYIKVAVALSRRVVDTPDNARLLALNAAGKAVDLLLRPYGREAAILFLSGEAAAELEAKGASAAGAFALTALAELAGKEVRTAYVGAQSTRWGLDPFARGAWPAKPLPVLAEPHHDRVFFAGDATDNGRLSGAYTSGLRAAEQAKRALA
jgi:monoamine oxidase